MADTDNEVTITVPTDKITTQLRQWMADGLTPEQAAKKVADAYHPAPVVEHMFPLLVREARSIVYKAERSRERKTVFRDHHGGLSDSERERISVATFRDGHGNKIEWGRATKEQHLARILWNKTRRDLLDRDSERHEAAIKLIESTGAECLDDIDNWHERISDICEHWVDEPAERAVLDDRDADENGDDRDSEQAT